MSVSYQQRHRKGNRCPICDGADGDPRGKEKRCHGFTSDDGEWCHCSRDEFAGGLPQESGGTYAHKLHGPCRCGVTHNPNNRSKASREIEAIYPYTDEAGKLLFQVVRYVGKDFRQRRPDGAGGWLWQLGDTRRVPYKLPDLVADDADRTVHIPEGEKDVDALTKRGFLATCNPGGAGKFHFVAASLVPVLAGRDVVVIADNDAPGREHAREIAKWLTNTRSLRLMRCPKHKDISDHFAAGGTIEELVPLEDEADVEKPCASDPLRGLEHLPKVAVLGRDRIVELAERPVVWLWEYIATAGLTILLAAGPGSGKTTLLFLLIVARANRGAAVLVLGRKVMPAPTGRWIVVIENEHSDESAARILRKSCRLAGVGEEALDCIILVARGSVRIGSPAWLDVEKLVGLGLVSDIVLDTLARVSPEADANDEGEQVAIFDRIATAIELAPTPDTRPTVWMAAHTRKCDGVPTLNDVSGSTQRAGQADVVILMGANRTAERVTSVTAVFGKVREKDAEDWPEPVEYTVTKAGIVIAEKDDPSDDRPLEERILTRLRLGPRTKNKLATELNRSDADIDGALTALFEMRRVRTTTVVVRGRGYKAFDLRHDAPARPIEEAAE